MIAEGHRPSDVWSYTPRQIKAFQFLAILRQRKRDAKQLTLQTLAARGNMRELDKEFKRLTRE